MFTFVDGGLSSFLGCEYENIGDGSYSSIRTAGPVVDATSLLSCSSDFAAQSLYPFCGCTGGLGGGLDGLMVFSLVMTLISTAAKVYKLVTNIRKRHQNIEDAYVQKKQKGLDRSGIFAVEMGAISGSKSEEVGGDEGEDQALLARVDRMEKDFKKVERTLTKKLTALERVVNEIKGEESN